MQIGFPFILVFVTGMLLYFGGLVWILFRKGITGPRFGLFMVATFALIIAVNVTMAYQASATFPGLEVNNSYVASQSFDADAKAQRALGWTVTPRYDGAQSALDLAITDASGAPVKVRNLMVLLGRPTEAKEDMQPRFVFEGGVYRAIAALDPGKWMMHVEARAPDGTLFRQRRNIFVAS